MLKKYDYHCPSCDRLISKENLLHFVVMDTKGVKAPLTLSAYPGVYGYTADQHLTINTGDKIDFFCTSCDASLTSERFPDYVEMRLSTPNGGMMEVLFSPVCGQEESLVVVNGKPVNYLDNFVSVQFSEDPTES